MRTKSPRTPTEKNGLARGEKALLVSSILVVILVIGGTVLWQRGNTAPIINVPPPQALPSPNAYDFYSRAGKAAIEVNPLTGASSAARPGTPPAPLPARLALVHSNQPAFDLLHQGFAYPSVSPSMRGMAGISTLFPEYAKMRSLARVLSFSAKARADQGNYPAAWDYGLDSVRMGSDLSHGGPLISVLVGMAIEAIGRRPLWGYVDKLSAPEARARAHRLETIEAKRAPFAETVREEKYIGQSLLADIFKENTFRMAQQLPAFAGTSSTPTGSPAEQFSRTLEIMRLQAQLVNKGKRGIYEDYTNYMDRQIAAASVPFPTMPPEPIMPDDPYTAILVPVISQGNFKDSANRMESQLLLAALALHAYQLEHHTYPADLSDLIAGGYVAQVPADPFAAKVGMPLRYKRLAPNRFLLYSLGADGKDDNGKPILQKPDRHWLESDQKGDYVYGVSTYPK